MRYLITGAAGFIGSHFVRGLVSGEFGNATSVTAYDMLSYAGNRANLADVESQIRFVRGDICDREKLDHVVPGHDVVINFAAESHVDRSLTHTGDFMRTNVLGVQTLFDACRDHEIPRVVQIGTDEVYGSIDTGSWTENSPLRPNSPYSASKAAAELLVRAYSRTYGLPVMSTRCSNNYGSHQFPEKAIPLFVTRLIDGGMIPLYGDGRHTRDWIHVSDHCRAIDTVVHHGEDGHSYNISGGLELSNRDLVSRLLQFMGRSWDDVEHTADRPAHDVRYSVDDSAVRQLGYRPLVSFDVGLADTIEWYQQNEVWWRRLISSPHSRGGSP